MSRGLRTLIAVLSAYALAACSGGSTSAHVPPTQTPTPTPSATTPADQAVQQLAQAGLRASYRASYLAHQAKPSRRAIWKVARTPTSLRIDVIDGRVTATLIVDNRGAFACKAVGRRKTCFLVAHAGKPVPTPFDLAPRALFAADLSALATHTDSYDVAAAPTPAATPGVSGTCFSIHALSSAPHPAVATGVYCFATTGALTAVRFPTGSWARLTALSLHAPPAAVFRPYSSPTPIPR